MKLGFNTVATALVAACALLAASPGFAAGGAGGGGGGAAVAVVPLAAVAVAAAVAVSTWPSSGRWALLSSNLPMPWETLPGFQGGSQISLYGTNFQWGGPPDTVVTINGVQIFGACNGAACPPGPPPTMEPDNIVHIVESSASLHKSLTLDLPCPVVGLTISPPAGSSLAGLSSVNLLFNPLPDLTGTPQTLVSQFPVASLSTYDSRTGSSVSGISTQGLAYGATSASLPILPATVLSNQLGNANNDMVELSYPGPLVVGPNAETLGYCVRKIRTLYPF